MDKYLAGSRLILNIERCKVRWGNEGIVQKCDFHTFATNFIFFKILDMLHGENGLNLFFADMSDT